MVKCQTLFWILIQTSSLLLLFRWNISLNSSRKPLVTKLSVRIILINKSQKSHTHISSTDWQKLFVLIYKCSLRQVRQNTVSFIATQGTRSQGDRTQVKISWRFPFSLWIDFQLGSSIYVCITSTYFCIFSDPLINNVSSTEWLIT